MAPAPSSPRLPSPPPPAEIQIGPKSPSGGAMVSPQTAQLEQTVLDANSKRRIHPGTKAADMAAGPPLLDSAFQLQEHLAALHFHHTASCTQALTRATALNLAPPPTGIDRTLWLYELCRFLISQCNSLIVGFLFDTPACSASTCPEMRASEWQFLCAVHEQPKSCCAIDYCCHTLDWAANVVSDQKIFPSRFAVLSDAYNKNIAVKNLINVFRRLHRIFAHAWFQHRTVFWAVEGRTGLYVFFKTVCDLYDLLPAENYKLPPEAEGLESPPSDVETQPVPGKPVPTILQPPSKPRGGSGDLGDGSNADGDNSHLMGRTNTRRHIRSSPSTGSAVTTVMEADEEDADSASSKMRAMHISSQGPSNMPEGKPADETDGPSVVKPSAVANGELEASPGIDVGKQDADAEGNAKQDLEGDPEEEKDPDADEGAPLNGMPMSPTDETEFGLEGAAEAESARQDEAATKAEPSATQTEATVTKAGNSRREEEEASKKDEALAAAPPAGEVEAEVKAEPPEERE